MIITRTPLRISIGGGGTDLPSYYEQFGGFVISAAINKYIYITVNRTFRPGYLLKYAETEHVQTINEIQHGLLRETLRLMEIEPMVETVSIADVPAGTGLGSSGSFTVGLLHAFRAYKRLKISAEELAQTANHIEAEGAKLVGFLMVPSSDPFESVHRRIQHSSHERPRPIRRMT